MARKSQKQVEEVEAEPEVEVEAEPESSGKKGSKKADTAQSAMALAKSVVSKLYAKKQQEPPFVDTSTLKQSIPFVPTGSFVLDYLIGGIPNQFGVLPCPGWPQGRLVQVYGKESSGKTTLALKACAQLNAMGKGVLYIDFEQAIDIQYARRLGVKVDDENLFQLTQPRTLEEGLQLIIAYATYGVGMIVVDSVGAGVPQAVANRSLAEAGDNAQVAAVARFWSNSLPQIATVIHKSLTILMGISQTRKQISAMPAAEDVIQGGNAWAFYTSLRLGLKHMENVKSNRVDLLKGVSDKMSVANRVLAIVKKSKVSQNQHRSGDLFFVHGLGVDNLSSAFQIGVRTGVIVKAGANYGWNHPTQGELKYKGEDKFKTEIRKAGYADQLVAEVANYLRSSAPNLEEEAEEAEQDDLVGSEVLDALN